MCSPVSKSDIPLEPQCTSCRKEEINDNSNDCKPVEFEKLENAIRKVDGENNKNETIIVYPKVLKIADKDVETSNFVENNSEKEDDELRRRAYRMYKQYLAEKDEEEKPSYAYIEPRKRPYRSNRCGAFVHDDEGDYGYETRSNMFLAIVFMILFVMLLCTTGFIYVVLNTESLKEFFKENSLYLSLPALIIMLGMNYAMACSECTRMLPCNFLCLLLSVASMSVLAAVITVLVNTTVVLLVFAATAAVVLFCILLAFSPFDFTTWFLYVIAIFIAIFAIALLVISIKKILNIQYGPIELFILIVSTILNVVILVIVLQMVLGGKSVQLDERDYVLGAFLLYTAIIELFLSLVQLTGVLEEYDE